MKAILVSVDYADLLAITLPYNRHHFERVMVVTSTRDFETRWVAQKYGAAVLQTDAFYDDGAVFNKWKALEQGLDLLGRDGWLCVMDADVLWPQSVSLLLRPGCLHTPYRRMLEDVNSLRMAATDMEDLAIRVPEEHTWARYPRHRQSREFAGYSQIFHAEDPVLGPPPWHQVDWLHAGGADSFFQQKWPEERKVRPPFDVLHLGPAGMNWCGRASPNVRTNTPPPEAGDRLTQLNKFMLGRRGKAGAERFNHERLPGPSS